MWIIYVNVLEFFKLLICVSLLKSFGDKKILPSGNFETGIFDLE